RALVFEDQRAEAPRLRLGQPAHQVVVEVVELEVDVRDVELPRHRLADLLVAGEALLDQHAPEPPARLLLLLQREAQLLLRDDLLGDQQVAEANLFWASHAWPSVRAAVFDHDDVGRAFDRAPRNVRVGKPGGKMRGKKLGAEPLRALPLSDPSERGGGGTDESAATHKS